MIVRHITEDGYLKFAFVGGVDRRVVLGKAGLCRPGNGSRGSSA
ncbi:MAG: hypothetical protein ACOX0U_02495 [Oscillospiraceae bacterium]